MLRPPESLPCHLAARTKMSPGPVLGSAGWPLLLLMLLVAKRAGKAACLGGHLAVSIRKQLLPRIVASSKLQRLLGPPFHKASRAAVRIERADAGTV